ncbi:MAG: DUF503 domain-containing protein [Acidobacteria bacterium]|nr:DUF503 domain-containing protein [Acidobacteriota bacterium]
MCIGFFRVDLFLPGAASLKDKRQVLRRLKDRLSGRHNLSIAEIDHQDLWQRSRLGMVMIGTERAVLDRSLQGVRAEIERLVPGAVVDFSVEYLA